jgi:hypothetical protein
MSRAVLQPDGSYLAYLAEPVGEPERLLERLRPEIAPDGILLLGFDFPIGLPAAYARRAAIDDFLSTLPELGKGEWGDFYRVAAQPDEIHLRRPFYPARPGAARQSHLLDALGFPSMDDLRRECERARPGRRAAAPLFWTLGGQQVGKAAISGWTQVLAPALRQGQTGAPVAVWPFSGRFSDLLLPGAAVLAETYPAEYYTHLGVAFSPASGGKRSQLARRDKAVRLLEWSEKAGVALEPALRQALLDGFGPKPNGEDLFDATIGLLGMLNLILGLQPLDEPADRRLRKVEGWILGQPCPSDVLPDIPV